MACLLRTSRKKRGVMHVPDGFLSLPVSAATGVVAVAAVGVALRGARRELDERTAPLAGLVATFVFAAQMVNFPVGAGTSGHLIGGALAAVLVGPWTATLVLTVVTVVQALLFADGGLTALGTNVLLLAVVAVWVGWAGAALVRRFAPRARRLPSRSCRRRRSLGGWFRWPARWAPSSACPQQPWCSPFCTPWAARSPSRWLHWRGRCSASTP